MKKWHLEIADSAVLTKDQEKCTRLFAQTVVQKLKFLSNQPKEDLCIVENVIQNIENTDRIKNVLD